MSRTRFPGRAFERTLRTPPFKDAEVAGDEGGEEPARKFYYLRLMRVSIRHDYYNRSNDECPDFTIYPTAATLDLMHNLGLLFKDEGTGFSILYDVRRQDVLLSYLKREAWPPKSKHCWVRLSFILSLNNPYFLNFTDLPIGFKPVNKNFYFTNQNARKQDGVIVLNPGPEQELLPLVPVQFGVPVSNKVKEVKVQDIAKETVLCRPRCIPVELLNPVDPSDPVNPFNPVKPLKKLPPSQVTCEMAKKCKGPHEPKKPGDPKCICTNKLYLDFSFLPEDRYTIKRVLYPSVSSPTLEDRPVLYTESYPTPFCFINLFVTDPLNQIGEKSGLFPVRHLFNEKVKPTVETVSYELKFERRSTYWNYFIVPRSGEAIENLRIEGEAAIRFNGPCSVYLPDGAKAYRFVSKKPLPFIQQSPFRFRLTGEIGMTAQNSVLMERLPVASAEQVLQDELTACLKLDGTIRQGARAECRKLKGQICRCVCANLPVDKCVKLLKSLCADPQNPRCQERRLGCSKIYSDTYVYV